MCEEAGGGGTCGEGGWIGLMRAVCGWVVGGWLGKGCVKGEGRDVCGWVVWLW